MAGEAGKGQEASTLVDLICCNKAAEEALNCTLRTQEACVRPESLPGHRSSRDFGSAA